MISIIHQSISKYVPFAKAKHKLKTPTHMKHLLSQKKKYYRLSKTNPEAKELYKDCAKAYKTAVSDFFRSQEQQVVTANDKNALFKYVNRRLHSSSGIPPIKNERGDLTFESIDKANLFNNSFAKVFRPDNGTKPTLSSLSSSDFSSMPSFLIRPADVKTAINSLKNSVSRTPEDIPAIFLKKTLSSLIYPLTEFFNLSISLGQLPPTWKSAIIVPIFKKGLTSEPLNYRPISLTSVICRILEKIIHKKIYEHLFRHSLLSNEQHGFLKNRSTLSQQLILLNKLTTYHDKSINTDMIYLDFSKAFDSVSHKKILHVLRHFKINESLINWMREYLTGRTQRTVIDGEYSARCEIKSGVPQGSVLGPLLFVLYIDNLIKSIKSKCSSTSVFAFADDVKLLGSDPIDIQLALRVVEAWTEQWQLRIQPTKTEHISFTRTSDRTPPDFDINGVTIPKVDSVKDLGLILSNDLKWNRYVDKVKLKASRLSNLLLRTFKSPSLPLYIKVYKTYIRPSLEYNTPIWSSPSKANIKTIESVQKKFTKNVCKRLNLKFDSYTHRLNIFNIESLEYRRKKFDLVLVYKLLNGYIDVDSDHFFLKSTFYQTYNLRRHNQCLNPLKTAKNNIKNNFFAIRSLNIWNKLPNNLVKSESLKIFKKNLNEINLYDYCEFIF